MLTQVQARMTSLDLNMWKVLLSSSTQRFPTTSLKASPQAPLYNQPHISKGKT